MELRQKKKTFVQYDTTKGTRNAYAKTVSFQFARAHGVIVFVCQRQAAKFELMKLALQPWFCGTYPDFPSVKNRMCH